MATTTPNFGWAVPTSTDLVKDGAVAIETLGDSIDASLVDLKGGTTNQVLAKNSNTDMDFKWVADASGIPATILDAKGDLIAATAADTASRLAVGANGTVLTADSAEATGLKWATPSSGGGLTLLATATPSAAASFNFTSISGSYKNLLMVWKNFSASAAGTFATMTLNNDTGSNYDFQTLRIRSQGSNISVTAEDNGPVNSMMGSTSVNQAFGGQFAGLVVQTAGRGWLRIYNYTASNFTNYDWHSKSYDQSVPNTIGTHGWGGYNNSAAITRIDVTASGGTLSGTCFLYGES